MKKLVIFGSTGSIGKQTLEVVRQFPNDFCVVGLTAKSNKELLEKQAKEFGAEAHLGLAEKEKLIAKADYIINGVPGFDGLEISVATLEASTPQASKTLLSANKESLAIAGRWLRDLSARQGARIFPLDSEASAIWQLMHQTRSEAECLCSSKKHEISSVTLTCSGGPFLGKTAADLAEVTVEQALAHPTWKMGPKVSIDSATLINKVLEAHEVHNLFDIPLTDIHITIHPQSLAHSMIHTRSGATKMHITQNDMRLFISYALHYPDQPAPPWPIERTPKSELDFQEPDSKTFRSLAWHNLHKGNPNFPIVLNAMNDIAVERFLAGEITFLGIYDFIEAGLEEFLWEVPPATLEDMIKFHQKITDYNQTRSEAKGRRAGRAKGAQAQQRAEGATLL